jgi:ElaB/YqjD/DUF883 family membrane-anchored ribosome-binding protein
MSSVYADAASILDTAEDLIKRYGDIASQEAAEIGRLAGEAGDTAEQMYWAMVWLKLLELQR